MLNNTTYIENWGSGGKTYHGGLPKERCRCTTWTVNGGFVVVTFKRPTTDDIQGVPQDNELDDWIEKQIRNNPQISTDDLAE